MGPTSILIAVAYAAAVALGIGAAVAIWRSTGSRTAPDTRRLAERERTWLWVVLALLAALLAATIFFTPYGESTPDGAQRVHVVASQFAWQIDPPAVRAGVPVEFRLDSSDVNHAFGVYSPDGELVFQVQVMPKYTHRVVHTFGQPGTYEVLCLEYCGVEHHGMIGRFEVRR